MIRALHPPSPGFSSVWTLSLKILVVPKLHNSGHFLNRSAAALESTSAALKSTPVHNFILKKNLQ